MLHGGGVWKLGHEHPGRRKKLRRRMVDREVRVQLDERAVEYKPEHAGGIKISCMDVLLHPSTVVGKHLPFVACANHKIPPRVHEWE